MNNVEVLFPKFGDEVKIIFDSPMSRMVCILVRRSSHVYSVALHLSGSQRLRQVLLHYLLPLDHRLVRLCPAWGARDTTCARRPLKCCLEYSDETSLTAHYNAVVCARASVRLWHGILLCM